eukprot:m.182071 g.182071  ORF g.182071 m.182071 type:complete len:241 (-) comp10480_c0_seq2:87-809(-)
MILISSSRRWPWLSSHPGPTTPSTTSSARRRFSVAASTLPVAPVAPLHVSLTGFDLAMSGQFQRRDNSHFIATGAFNEADHLPASFFWSDSSDPLPRELLPSECSIRLVRTVQGECPTPSAQSIGIVTQPFADLQVGQWVLESSDFSSRRTDTWRKLRNSIGTLYHFQAVDMDGVPFAESLPFTSDVCKRQREKRTASASKKATGSAVKSARSGKRAAKEPKRLQAASSPRPLLPMLPSL